MIVGPGYFLDAEDIPALYAAVIRELERQRCLNGAPSARLERIGRDLRELERQLRNNRRALSQVTRLHATSATGDAADSGTVSTAEAAAMLGVSSTYTRRLCATGVLQAHRGLGGAWRIEETSLAAFASKRNAA
ncbi:helix-turn-helix domain-containing protein [Streptomyces sp. NPDC005708]|uniref:helix-turn-helix domain-containing protein n=1 Tax=Streptomyces sp. NPDC005708 TaxID=3154564 RepID=UPI0033D05CFD